MKNRDIYVQDPSQRKLVNEGVATVNDDRSDQALAVLRYELETFVCDGQYEKGLEHILDTFLRNMGQAQQPGVWVSGFYGSGKSHLVKMLRALWVDTSFKDGARARGIASLSNGITDRLKELDIQAKRHGGVHAASGTPGSWAEGSVRLALLSILFKSAGLPERYPIACFVLWLRKEGILDPVRSWVEEQGGNWSEELDNLYVSDLLSAALMRVRPNLFVSQAACAESINNLFPSVQDVSSDDMLKTIRQTLTREKRFPLTLIVLDEVQQFIGDDSRRSLEVQEVVEACCKGMGSSLLFIATGQTAVTGTSNLKKLEGRFPIRVELSDADVNSVVRKVILAKKPESHVFLDAMLRKNKGEISRHLSGSGIAHRQEDENVLMQDYPILPVRRRFWERTMRVLDSTGTRSQLRNQLSMIHKVIQTNLEETLGHVIPGDALYFDLADTLLQHRILPRKVHEKTMTWIQGSREERLTARACGLVFLVNKLLGGHEEAGVRATVDTLADLLLENLAGGSGSLRAELPRLLGRCDLIMQVNDEYRMRTEESTAWNDEFLSHQAEIAETAYKIENERMIRLRHRMEERLKKLTLTQGDTRIERKIELLFNTRPPTKQGLYLWILDEWTLDVASLQADARAAGNTSPVIFASIPKRSPDDLRRCIIDYKAAEITLEQRVEPGTSEGREARAVMETTRHHADMRIHALLDDSLSGVRVFQGGGNEVTGGNLQEMVLEAAKDSVCRLYPQFQAGDHPGWAKVYDEARKGGPDALKQVGHAGEPANQAVCKAILGFIGGGKSGKDIRVHFEGAPYGWPGDAVDGGLQVLLTAGLVRVTDERGQPITADKLERRVLGKCLFRVEAVTITTPQRIQIRRLMLKAGCQARQNEESAMVPEFLLRLKELAGRAGGDPPKPVLPDMASLEEMRASSGNEQLMTIHNPKSGNWIGSNLENILR
ncbi:MAG: BREX system P-loop protein BrxC, partial [Magnetococcales bacterium]|nr:BREX system P-loop protein BrxC [Magnetococcales bacterium]